MNLCGTSNMGNFVCGTMPQAIKVASFILFNEL